VLPGGSCWQFGNHLYRRDDDMFRFDSTAALGGYGSSLAAAWADIDDDGDLDVYIAEWDVCLASQLVRNDNSNGNHWLKVHLEGVASNRSAIGARVEIFAEEGPQMRDVQGGGYRSQGSRTLHFGLGPAANVDLLRVFWPSGAINAFRDVSADQTVHITEGAGDATAVQRGAPAIGDLHLVPNPSQGLTSVRFRLTRDSETDLSVHDVAGRRVRTLANGRLRPGAHRLSWDGTRDDGARVAAGVYYVRLRTAETELSRKVVLIR
jgi:hypothetical protein